MQFDKSGDKLIFRDNNKNLNTSSKDQSQQKNINKESMEEIEFEIPKKVSKNGLKLEFKKILDRDQRNKLSMIQKLQRKSIKDAQKVKDYQKSNPKMRPFAQY